MSASKSPSGDPVQARLLEPFVVDSRVVLPAGSVFEGRVLKATPPRTLSRAGSLGLTFTGTTVADGSQFPVRASLVRATSQLGYPESAILGIGGTLLVCTLLYVVPRTSTLGVVLLTGYLGGAVASNIRAGMPLFNILFPMAIAGLPGAGCGFATWAFEISYRKNLQPQALNLSF